MELLTLALLYILSKNPEFSEKTQPLLRELKNSEEFLKFVSSLSDLSSIFPFAKAQKDCAPQKDEPPKTDKNQGECKEEKQKEYEKNRPQSPTEKIANEFIMQCLDGYLHRA